jgi:CRP-like cAMP-binding protein
MENLERLLREHHFLEGLSPEQIQFLVGCAKNVRFHAGQWMFREGETADELFLLRQGTVGLEVHVPGKGAVVMETLGPGDIVGFSWLFPPHRTHLDGRARDEVVALSFDGECLRRKMEEDPVLGYGLTKRLLQQVYKRLERVRMQRLDIYLAD